jgi:hypothetical protein
VGWDERKLPLRLSPNGAATQRTSCAACCTLKLAHKNPGFVRAGPECISFAQRSEGKRKTKEEVDRIPIRLTFADPFQPSFSPEEEA